MKLQRFIVSLLFLTVIAYSKSENPLIGETSFAYVRKSDSYIASIKFNESSSHWSNETGTAVDFFDKINDDQVEKSLNTSSLKDIERYIGCGLETFRKSIIGFEKIKSELETRTRQSNESIMLHDTSFLLPVNTSNTTVLIEYNNVFLRPFTNSSVCTIEPVVPDNENTTVFYITSKCHVPSLVMCGEHNITVKGTVNATEQMLYGSFCCEVLNVTYKSQSGMSIKAGGSIANVDLTEEVKYGSLSNHNYKRITFSTQFGWWPIFGLIHQFGLAEKIHHDYIQPIGMRLRQIVQSHHDYLLLQQNFLNTYRQTVVNSIIRLIRLYFRKCDDSLQVETGGDGGTVKFEKFSRSLYVYPKIKAVEWSVFKIETEIHYQDAAAEQKTNDNFPSITTFDKSKTEISRHAVKSVTLNVTLELNDSAESGLVPELIVKDFDFEFIFTDSAPISDDAKAAIRWAIKNKIDDYTSSMKNCRSGL